MRKKIAQWEDWDKLGYATMTGNYRYTQSYLQNLLPFYHFGSAAA